MRRRRSCNHNNLKAQERMALPTTSSPKKRHVTTKDPVERCLKRGSLRSLNRRGGVVKMGGDCYDGLREFGRAQLVDIIKDANAYRRYRKSKTITSTGVRLAFQRKGIILAGIATPPQRKKRAAASKRKSDAAVIRIAAARADASAEGV